MPANFHHIGCDVSKGQVGRDKRLQDLKRVCFGEGLRGFIPDIVGEVKTHGVDASGPPIGRKHQAGVVGLSRHDGFVGHLDTFVVNSHAAGVGFVFRGRPLHGEVQWLIGFKRGRELNGRDDGPVVVNQMDHGIHAVLPSVRVR